MKANTRTAPSSVPSKGSQGHPSAPVQLRLRLSTFAVATDTTAGEPFNFFLPKSKSSSSRSSVLSACRSIFTKQNVPVVTRDGPVHYYACTCFRMPIKLFLIRIWQRPPPPFSSEIRILKNFENYGRPLTGHFSPAKRPVWLSNELSFFFR